MSKDLRGYISAITGGILWGASGCFGQYLTQDKAVDPVGLTAIRLLSAGVILVLISLCFKRQNLLALLSTRRELLRAVCFGVFGMMLCQLSYLCAIAETNAATATVIQYVGPVLVCVVVCLRDKKPPSASETAAVLLAVSGTYLVATHGDPRSLVITPLGLFWCIVAAVTVVLYTLIPGTLTARRSAIVVSGVGMTVGGAVLTLLFGIRNISLPTDAAALLALFGIVLLGTVGAFSLYLSAVSDIGAVKASVLASIEPVASAVISFFWLGVRFSWLDIVGFVLIISTVFVLAIRKKRSSST